MRPRTDDNDILTYTLGDTTEDGAFDIDQATGQIKTKAELNADATWCCQATQSQSRPRTRPEIPTPSR